jgi:hypothetical protein
MRLQCAGFSPGGVPERPKGAVCKTVGSAYGGSNPPAPTPAWLEDSGRPRLSYAGPPLGDAVLYAPAQALR